MELLARFDRSPHEEIRLTLISWQGDPCVEFRVYSRALPGGGVVGPESLHVPVGGLEELEWAVQIARERLRQRKPPPPAAEDSPGPRAGLPLAGRVGVHQGRAHPRPPLTCPVEYAVRGRTGEGKDPEWRRGQSLDVSRNGLQVLLPERLSVLTPLQIALRLPRAALGVGCEVVWAQLSQGAARAGEGYRHGVRFTDVEPRARRSLDLLLEDIGG